MDSTILQIQETSQWSETGIQIEANENVHECSKWPSIKAHFFPFIQIAQQRFLCRDGIKSLP